MPRFPRTAISIARNFSKLPALYCCLMLSAPPPSVCSAAHGRSEFDLLIDEAVLVQKTVALSQARQPEMTHEEGLAGMRRMLYKYLETVHEENVLEAKTSQVGQDLGSRTRAMPQHADQGSVPGHRELVQDGSLNTMQSAFAIALANRHKEEDAKQRVSEAGAADVRPEAEKRKSSSPGQVKRTRRAVKPMQLVLGSRQEQAGGALSEAQLAQGASLRYYANETNACVKDPESCFRKFQVVEPALSLNLKEQALEREKLDVADRDITAKRSLDCPSLEGTCRMIVGGSSSGTAGDIMRAVAHKLPQHADAKRLPVPDWSSDPAVMVIYPSGEDSECCHLLHALADDPKVEFVEYDIPERLEIRLTEAALVALAKERQGTGFFAHSAARRTNAVFTHLIFLASVFHFLSSRD
eukprot:gnl/TRDRNA2_/TRDRNA2_87962_c0_seq1.p1 gnl/TRDRNA2_/TRDRNA2_87962_c0~~gnl/TRDRNA2_/TRDRNA2_87962_c0_seq1.p1  ORF type:complete len:411 (-),score=73.18 gnl/TRDRNA2_/TRDRNA2_87962_c0_seq1:43-1275(-)